MPFMSLTGVFSLLEHIFFVPLLNGLLAEILECLMNVLDEPLKCASKGFIAKIEQKHRNANLLFWEPKENETIKDEEVTYEWDMI